LLSMEQRSCGWELLGAAQQMRPVLPVSLCKLHARH
jgi:hypothetical protein